MSFVSALRGLSILLMLGICFPFADYMTNPRYCGVSLKVGSVIMGQEVVQSTDHQLELYQNGFKLENGTVVTNGMDFTVKLVPPIYEMVLECSAGFIFKHGDCDGRRTNGNDAVLLPNTVPSTDVTVLQVVGAWATGYANGVRFTPTFTLHFPPVPPAVAETHMPESDPSEL